MKKSNECRGMPGPDATALANVYAFILDSAKKKSRLPDKSGPENAKERSKDNFRAETIVRK